MPSTTKRKKPAARKNRTETFTIRGLDSQLARYLKLLTRDGFYGDRSAQAVAIRFIREGITRRLEEGCPIIKAEIKRISQQGGVPPVTGRSPLAKRSVTLNTLIFRGNQAAAIEELAENFFGPFPEDVVRFLVTERLEKMRLEKSPFLEETAAAIRNQTA